MPFLGPGYVAAANILCAAHIVLMLLVGAFLLLWPRADAATRPGRRILGILALGLLLIAAVVLWSMPDGEATPLATARRPPREVLRNAALLPLFLIFMMQFPFVALAVGRGREMLRFLLCIYLFWGGRIVLGAYLLFR